MNVLRRVLLIGTAVATTLGLASSSPVFASGGGGPTAQSLLGSGSDTTQVMMSGIDSLYLFSPGCNGIAPSGTTQWLDFSCQSPDPLDTAVGASGTGTESGTSTFGSSTVTMADTTGIVPGLLVTGPGVPAQTYVGAVTANTSITLSNSPSSNRKIGASTGAGSGTFSFYNILYSENYEHDQVHEADFLGSSSGINQLCETGQAGVSHVDWARSSRAPKTTDCTGLHFVAYALDAISWEAFNVSGSGINGMANTTSPCSGATTGATEFCLTQSQLQGIFVTCSITNWDQVGGNNVPIVPYTFQSNSGTRATFDAFLGGSSSNCVSSPSHIIPENENYDVAAADIPGAILPFSHGIWATQIKGKGGAVFGAIDNVVASSTTVQNGSFPYTRDLYNVWCSPTPATGGGVSGCAQNTPNQAGSPASVYNYVGEDGWICKPSWQHGINPATGNNFTTDIQNVIKADGFYPFKSGPVGSGDLSSDYCRLFKT